jgi:hypothetical protein
LTNPDKGYDALMELHDVNPDRLLGDNGMKATPFATTPAAPQHLRLIPMGHAGLAPNETGII